ncbi:gliding motility-associated C-terminal domain-containing protein, partial [Mesonia phycicola]
LNVIAAPTANTPTALELCDANNDGSESFDLSQLDAFITGSDPDLSVAYYGTQTGASNATASDLITSPYTSGTATVYARVDSATISCYNTVSVDLIVNPSPDLPSTITSIEECDENETGIMIFDLQDRETEVLANLANPAAYTVAYYDATGAAIAASDVNNYSSGSTTITVEVTDGNNCSSTTTFDLVVNPLPAYNTPTTLVVCDEGQANGLATFDLLTATSQITGNDPNLTVLYYENMADAQAAGTNDLGTSYMNTTAYAQTIYLNITNNTTGCFTVTSLDLQVDVSPAAYTPAVFEYCDDDNDGEGIFILTDLDAEITGGATGVTVTYHRTQADADNDVNPISSPFTNTVNYSQTIYARVESPGVACFNTVDVSLLVLDSPDLVAAANLVALEECDTTSSGNAVFDLTDMADDILANETNPSAFTLTYYASQADLTSGNEISVPTAYTANAPSETIYVLVEGSNGCQDETSFEVIVNSLPTIYPPVPLELCDDNNPGDEKEFFNLTDATLEINGGDTSIDVQYYLTQADADNNVNALSSPYENTINNQTIYIRAEDSNTGCYVSQGYTLTLTVNPLPSPEIPTLPIEVCDEDNDGIAEFDLALLAVDILGTEPDVTITFHTTISSANSGGNPIDTSSLYGVNSSGSQIIYVRATNDLTDCYVTGQVELISVPTPEIENLEDLYVCDDNNDGFAVFDLTVNTANIIGSQNPADVMVSYHISQADAEAGTNAIIVPSMYTNTFNGQVIYVRIESNITGCIDAFDATNNNTFTLNVEMLPTIAEPTPLQLCDDDYNNVPVAQTIFDLTSKEGEITGQALPPNTYSFTYYASEQDYLNGNEIADPTNYENVINNQEIYVEVVNTATQGLCSDVVVLTLEVLPLPSPSITDPDELRLEECDDNNDGITAYPFDLTEAGAMISGSENVILTYYKTERAAEDGDTSSAEYIVDPTAYVNEPSYNSINDNDLIVQEIFVRVDSGINGNFCYVIVPIEIAVIKAPVLALVNPDEFGYTLCEDGNSSQATLFLEDIAENVYDNTVANPVTSELISLLDESENTDLDLDNYIITYYDSESDAEAGTNPISSGELASDGDLLYIRIEYGDTGCYNTGAIGAVRITVEPRPDIEEVDLMEIVCSDEQGGSTATIDLTAYNDDINPGAPADTEIVYYASMDDYMSGVNIDASQLSSYTTVENPQTIIAEVIDTVTLCESALYATITIEVDDRPVVDISGYDGYICEDVDPSTPTEGGDYDPVVIDTGLDTTIYSFEWSLDGNILIETGGVLEATQSGTYTVTVTNIVTGCSSTSSTTLIQSTPPEFSVEPLTLAFEGEHALLITASGNGDYEFRVDDGLWFDIGEDGTVTIDGLSSGSHLVYGRDKNGCGVTVNVINFIDYPKFFTPNEDGYNDRWNIIGLGEENAGAQIYIFDRYGKLLKQLSPTSEGWDGTFNGKVMPSGDYWFRIEYLQLQTDGELVKAEFKANFTLKR